jgi:hypothetical protein
MKLLPTGYYPRFIIPFLQEAPMMPNLHRLSGRFFTVLISLLVAFLVPRAAFPGSPADAALTGAATPRVYAADRGGLASAGVTAAPAGGPQASSSSASPASVLMARAAPLSPPASEPKGNTPAPTLCLISDTVFRADGSPAHGTVLLTWPSFTTAAGQAVTPGSLLVTLGADGSFNASLAPNTGASPVGTYYRAIFKLDDGTNETEFWVVPDTPTTTIGAIRSKLVPSNQAAQFLTRDFADSHYLNLTDDQAVAGVKTFGSSPSVPTPQNDNDAANKAYVDANAGGANLASPPPIGNVTPNSGNFTTLTAQSANDIQNAAAFPGADACARINAATAAALAAASSVVSAEAFSGPQICATTLTVNSGIHYRFPAATWTFTANPGIQITGSGTSSQPAILEGKGWNYSYDGNAGGTVFISGAAAPLIADSWSPSYPTLGHSIQIRNLELFGNGVGTFGYFSIFGQTILDNLHIHGFLYAGAVSLAGVSYYHNNLINNNGGDGLLLTSDFVLDGNHQVALNRGNGIHVISSGNRLTDVDSDHNALHGIYLDGRLPATTWSASTTYISPLLIQPSSGNLGNYYFYLATPNTTTGAAAPAWDQTPGRLVTDGTAVWINIGVPGQAPSLGSMGVNSIIGGYVDDNGNGEPAGFVADNIRIEGQSAANPSATWNHVAGTHVAQAQVTTYPATGIHCLYCQLNTFDGIDWLGGGYGGANAADQGGLILEHAISNEVSSFTSDLSMQNALRLLSASYNKIKGLNSHNTGNANTSLLDSYAVFVDSNSNGNIIDGPTITAGWAGARGIYNRGAVTVITGYISSLVSTPADDLQWAGLYGGFGYNNPISGTAEPYNLLVGGQGMWLDNAGNASFSRDLDIRGELSARDIPGHEYFVSKFATLQAAIDAAYNNGAVLGAVVDDRTSPYSGPGFILYDSVTLKLAPTTYTITGTVTYNNGNNNVTAGIILVPGARLTGAGTSTNHGTIVTAANGLNADLIATSTVGTGTTNPQWWHWGEIANLRIVGNASNQTAGACLKVENMGETASVHDLELSACYSNNAEFIGAAATQSAINNVTSNLSANGAGIAFTNLAGVGRLNGISGDCNHVALISSNQAAAGTLEVAGLKAEAESSICPSGVQDPVILSTTTDVSVAASIKVDGGYAFGTAQQDFLKSTGPGTIQFTLNNFYVTGYANILNDTVRSYTIANTSQVLKQPLMYLSTGLFFGNQSITLLNNTFLQGQPYTTPTEILGVTSSGGTLLGTAANGDDDSIITGGLQISSYNRTIYGQTPEPMARWGWRFLGPANGYDTTNFDLVPAWNSGDSSTRSLGNPLTVCQKGSATVSCRWPNIYALNVDTTTLSLNGNPLATVASSGSYNDLSNRPTIPAPGEHLVSASLQGTTAQLTGNGADQTLYTATLPAGTFAIGQGLRCKIAWTHPVTGSTSIAYKWTLGSTTVAYGAFTSSSQNLASDLEIFTISSLSSELLNAGGIVGGNAFQAGPSNGNSGSENLANSSTIKFTFNAASGEQVKGSTFYCSTIQ